MIDLRYGVTAKEATYKPLWDQPLERRPQQPRREQRDDATTLTVHS